MMNGEIYKSSIKGRSQKIVPILLILILGINILIYGVITTVDFFADSGLQIASRDLLHPMSKKELKKVDLTFSEWFSVIHREEGNFYLMVHFFNKLLRSPLKREIKLALIKYSIDILGEIKKSYLFLDLDALVLSYWDGNQEEIREKLKESLTLEPQFSLHPLLNKKILLKESRWISSWYQPPKLQHQHDFFRFLIRTKQYDKLVNFIEQGKLNIDKHTVDRTLARYLLQIKDQVRGERMLKQLIQKTQTDYSYYYLATLYLKQKAYQKALNTLNEMRKITYNQKYLLLYPAIYDGLKQYREGLYFLSKLPASQGKFRCGHYFKFIRKLPLKERSGELLKIVFICPKRHVYQHLISVYRKQKKSSLVDEYSLKLRMLGK